MKRQFYRFYLLMLVACAVLVISFNQLWQNVLNGPEQYSVTVNQLFQAARHNDLRDLVQYIDATSLFLPEELQASLNNGEQVAMVDSQGNMYIYKLHDDTKHVIRFGPVQTLSDDSNDDAWSIMVFYSVLAIMIMVLMRPLFLDLYKLQTAVSDFGQHHSFAPTGISNHSSLAPLAQSFERMAKQITDFIQLQQDLSRIISHEMRTPIARMKFVLHAIKKTISPEQHDRLRADMSELETRLNQYLSFARLEQQLLKKELHALPASEFVAEIVDRFSVYPDLNVAWQCQTDEVICHEEAMELALQTLISNSKHYAKGQIKVTLWRDEQQFNLQVEDNGPGFSCSSDVLLAAFQTGNIHGGGQGFGLGLYIVDKVAQWHGGSVALESSAELGGARVLLSWPMQHAKPLLLEAAEQQADTPS